MLNLINQIVARAKADRQRIVLPEGTEERTLKAANQILTDEVADLILLGKPAEINELAAKWGLGNISKATIIDPETSPKHEEYAQLLCELRKKKGMTIEEARNLTNDPLFYGCLRAVMLTVSWQVPATLPVMYCVLLYRLSRLLRESLVYQAQCCC